MAAPTTARPNERSRTSTPRWDAPFWAALVAVLFAVGALGCFGLAAAQTTQPLKAQIVAPTFR